MRLYILVMLFAISWSGYTQDDDYQLTVRVENVKSLEGNVVLGLFDQEEKFLEEVVVGEGKSVTESTVTFNFKGIKEGTYAISIFHDKNSNGELDANMFGIPKEPYAFSNNAKGTFGPPSFRDCQFHVDAGYNEIVIRF